MFAAYFQRHDDLGKPRSKREFFTDETVTQQPNLPNKGTNTMSETKSYDANLDFNLTEDYKEPGLIPDGTYHANVTSVVFDREKSCFTWKVTLAENGGVCTDDETAIDGNTLEFKNWLPKPGDEKEMTASGRMTKRQSKINSLAKFMKKMQLKEETVPQILEAIDNAEYIGLEVDINIGTKVFNDTTFNEVKDMFLP